MNGKRLRVRYGVFIAYMIAWMVGYTAVRSQGISIFGSVLMGLMFDACVLTFVGPRFR